MSTTLELGRISWRVIPRSSLSRRILQVISAKFQDGRRAGEEKLTYVVKSLRSVFRSRRLLTLFSANFILAARLAEKDGTTICRI